jgi:hypothetical protein
VKKQIQFISLVVALGVSPARATWEQEGDYMCEGTEAEPGEILIVCVETEDGEAPGTTCPPGWVPSGYDCVPWGGSEGAGNGDGHGGSHGGGSGGGGGGGGGGHVYDAMVDALGNASTCGLCYLGFQSCAHAAQNSFISCRTQMRTFAASQCQAGHWINGAYTPGLCDSSYFCDVCVDSWMQGDSEDQSSLSLSWPPGVGITEVKVSDGLQGLCQGERTPKLLACFNSHDCSEVCQ